jgi:TonB family protein
MKVYPISLALILIFVVCPNTFSQKCKEGVPKVGVFTNRGGPRITRKPQPEYTEEARRRQIQGTVLLRALFDSSGEVKNVCWVSGLPYGLTENAIKAAYRITFEPVIKNGRPVSVTSFVEYNFNLY